MGVSDEHWMHHALELAGRAEAEGEVPIGAVVVREGQVIGEGWNRNITLHDPSAHAEIMALRAAGQALGNHRLNGCELYVTLEPCGMCVAACIHARIQRLVFGAADPKTGALGGHYDLQAVALHNHQIACEGGILADEISAGLRNFFRQRR